MNGLFERVLDALYPDNVSCRICGREAVVDARGVCVECQSAIELAGEAQGSGAISAFYAGLKYNAKVSLPMQAFKYNGARYMARFFAQFMEVNKAWNIDAVVPIPLHGKKLQKRGYNQSELLARLVAERYGFKLDTAAVKRVKDTPTQTHMSAVERTENMQNAFAASAQAAKNILLIDDVRTTGSTLMACADALKAAGAEKIYALTACVAVLD